MILSALASIAISVGLSELSKALNRTGITQAEATKIANKIISAAEKKGQKYLNKAVEAINSIPQLASSPSVKEHLMKARQQATTNYNRIEEKVTDMKNQANDAASKVQDLTNKSVFEKGADWISGNSVKKQASSIANQAIQNIEKPIIEGGQN